MRDNKPLLLLLLSGILVITWVYHLYDKSKYQAPARIEIDSMSLTKRIHDSLDKEYSTTIAILQSKLAASKDSTDALKSRLDIKIGEINQLRSEILTIISKKYVSKNDLIVAKQKIGDLQTKVGELNDQNTLAGEEKRKMDLIVEQLSQNVDSLQLTVSRLNNENNLLTERVNQSTIFVASNVKIDGVDVKGASESLTAQAKRVNKFVARFIIQNHVKSFTNAELLAVLIQPNGEVLQSTVWDSGTFETKKEGVKPFTRRIKFDYDRDEQKQLLFSLDSDKSQKGVYAFQVWHNGVLIGKASTRLN